MPDISPTIVAGGLFVAVYALIVTERIHRTLAALLGGSLMIALGIIDQHEAFSHVDFNVIFLLAGMMIIANIMARTGVFQWLAVEAVRRAEGRPYRLLVMTAVITAIASAFLDNVTTVVLLTPITFFIAKRLGASPVPFLVSMVLASNIGGTATLIGDPPNILVGSAFDKDFNDFLVRLTPVVVVSMVAYLILARWLFRAELAKVASALEPDDIARLVRDERRIADIPLMRKSLAVMALVVLGFVLARPLNLEAATVALLGATVLMIIAREDVHEILKTVEWPTLLFFVGLFILVAGIVKVGIISSIAQGAIELTGGNVGVTAILVLWMSAVLSAIVDNIPYTATMIPLVQELATVMPIETIIWALVLGADFGGNATLVGASANVVVASMAEARGHPIGFGRFLRYGIPATLVTMIIATVDVLIRME